jgi:uncharacterized membrane protein YjjP (DUF1212 family)
MLTFAGFAAAVAAYLAVFHGTSPAKEVLSTAFAGTVGMYVGRLIERRFARV